MGIFLKIKNSITGDKAPKRKIIVTQVSKVASHVQERLSMVEDDLPYPPFFMHECNIEIRGNKGLQEYFEELAKISLSEITTYPELNTFLESSGRFEAGIEDAPIILIREALLDIYTLQIIGLHHDIPENILKKLLYNNMRYGNDSTKSGISYYIKSKTDALTGELSCTKDELIEGILGISGSGTKEEAACPFLEADNVNEWVEDIWNFLGKKVIPFMQKHYGNSLYDWEVFWSGVTK